jgi:transposase
LKVARAADERLWSSTQIKRWVKEQTGKQIHKTTAWRMFAKLNFTSQVPRPQHQKRASEAEQAEFKKS